jgi:hypothetical protein
MLIYMLITTFGQFIDQFHDLAIRERRDPDQDLLA